MLFSAGDIFTTFFKTASSEVPYYLAAFAVGNFLGPLLLGRLFDSVGRKLMIGLEDIAKPLTAEDSSPDAADHGRARPRPAPAVG